MILPNTFISTTANVIREFSGLDSLEACLNKEHFKSYPYSVNYHYNSRGFRDNEWPTTFDNCIWCLGDSFTCGLGQPFDHIWPQILQQKTNIRTINVSLDGASNNWIAKKAQEILSEFNSCTMVIHWSFLQRRELSETTAKEIRWKNFYQDVKDPSWPDVTLDQYATLSESIRTELEVVHRFSQWAMPTDEERRVHVDLNLTSEQNASNTIECIKSIESIKQDSKIIHSFITDFAFMSDDVTPSFEQRLELLDIKYIPEFPKLDLARDGFHYDKLTCNNFVDRIISIL